MKTIMIPLLLSLKPRYAQLVFNGKKTAELRRQIASRMENRDVFIYVSGPVKQLQGRFRVEKVWSGSPGEVWKHVSKLAGVNKEDFDAYYAGREIAHALEITNILKYEKPANLRALKKQFPDFVVPQSWRYVKPEEHRSFKSKKLIPQIWYRESRAS